MEPWTRRNGEKMQLPVSQLIPPGKYIQREKRKCLKKEEEEEEAKKKSIPCHGLEGFLKTPRSAQHLKKEQEHALLKDPRRK